MLCGFFKKKCNFAKKKLFKKRKYYYEKCYVMSSVQKDKLNVLFKKGFSLDYCKIYGNFLAVDFQYSNSSIMIIRIIFAFANHLHFFNSCTCNLCSSVTLIKSSKTHKFKLYIRVKNNFIKRCGLF